MGLKTQKQKVFSQGRMYVTCIDVSRPKPEVIWRRVVTYWPIEHAAASGPRFPGVLDGDNFGQAQVAGTSADEV